MRIGLIDVDRCSARSKSWPSLPLMKLSAWHKANGDTVNWYYPFEGLENPYYKVYMSKVFTFTADYIWPVYAHEIVQGGTGYNISTVLPSDVETVYPDYMLYGLTDTAYGFLTRGCQRKCPFCVVTQKEGCVSHKVANLDAFWRGQREVKLLDPNLLACPDHNDLLQQLADSGAWIDFSQGLDIRITDDDVNEMLMRCKVKTVHFAWDNERDSDLICRKLREFKRQTGLDERIAIVYVLTNYNTTHEFDLYRIYTLRDMGFNPYVMVYNKQNASKTHKQVQRWVNNRRIWQTCQRFEDYTR